MMAKAAEKADEQERSEDIERDSPETDEAEEAQGGRDDQDETAEDKAAEDETAEDKAAEDKTGEDKATEDKTGDEARNEDDAAEEGDAEDDGADEREDEAMADPPQKLRPTDLIREGKAVLQELTGRSPESVSGLDRHGDGWRLIVEVLELERIPNSTDVLGTYELDLTEDGELTGYRRKGRYLRNQAEGA
jgi:hypothetical protein